MSMTTKASNAIQELTGQGQSLWLDNLRRDLVTSGELARLRDAGVTGITSNPTIFEKAIGGSSDYDAALAELVNAGRRPDQMLWDLMLEDIQAAADIFRSVYEATTGSDGFVSIEVGPAIAGDTQQTINMAQDLHRRAARSNVMVKIPATRAGLPAIRHMIGLGKHTNVTLIFSVQRYAEVVEAYLSGLEDLQRNGGDLRQVSSVASFFVSRVDTKVDKLLTARIDASSGLGEKRELEKTVWQGWNRQLEDGLRALWRAVLRTAVASARAGWCEGSALPMGKHLGQGRSLSRHDVCRGVDRARHGRHCAERHAGGLHGSRSGTAEPGGIRVRGTQ
jgi:transaldolase